MLIDSKSNLARLMATENLVIEQRRVPTAYFDIKNRVLTVPILNGNLSPELYDLLMGHEVGHALETPEEGWHHSVIEIKEVSRTTLNICEDIRIEKKIKRRFPGIRPSFLKGYRELMDMDFFGVKGKDLNTLNFLDRINLHAKGGAQQNIRFSKQEIDLLEEAEDAETFKETVEVAKKIEAFMKKQEEKRQNEKPKSSSEKFLEPSLQEDDTEDTQQYSSNDSDVEDGDESGEGEDDDSGEDSKTGIVGSTDGKYNPVSITDQNFREREKELTSEASRKEYVYSSIPEVNLSKVIVSHKVVYEKFALINKLESNDGFYKPEVLLSNLNAFRKESNRVVSYLVKEFELRKNADQLSRAKVSKTGDLNMSRISEYKFTDDIFKRITKIPNGKSHGLVMYIDWSGSMSDHIHATVKQLLNLVMFCKKVSIPFEVYAISSNPDVDENVPYRGGLCGYQSMNIGELGIHSDFCLPNILSSKMTPKEFTNAASILLDFGTSRYSQTENVVVPQMMQLSGTPLNETIICAFDMIENFKRDNNLQIVNTVFLTDGNSISLMGRINGFNSIGSPYVEAIRPYLKKASFIRDPKTKAVVEIPVAGNGWASAEINNSYETRALLQLLKQRISGNLIGFYIANNRAASQCLNTYNPNQNNDKKLRDFRKNNYTVIDTAGYDDYYILRSDKLDIDDEEFSVTANTTKSLVSAFSKYTNNKISNRVVLNRFIHLIA
jgi:hypothetical protein